MLKSSAAIPSTVAAATLLQGLLLAEGRAIGVVLSLAAATLLSHLARRLRSLRATSHLLALSLGGLGMVWGENLEPRSAGLALMLLFCLPGCCFASGSCASAAWRGLCAGGCMVGMWAGMELAGWGLAAIGGTVSCHGGGMAAAGSHFTMLLGMSCGTWIAGELLASLSRYFSAPLNRPPGGPLPKELSPPWPT